jgi:hypothetical protein
LLFNSQDTQFKKIKNKNPTFKLEEKLKQLKKKVKCEMKKSKKQRFDSDEKPTTQQLSCHNLDAFDHIREHYVSYTLKQLYPLSVDEILNVFFHTTFFFLFFYYYTTRVTMKYENLIKKSETNHN